MLVAHKLCPRSVTPLLLRYVSTSPCSLLIEVLPLQEGGVIVLIELSLNSARCQPHLANRQKWWKVLWIAALYYIRLYYISIYIRKSENDEEIKSRWFLIYWAWIFIIIIITIFSVGSPTFLINCVSVTPDTLSHLPAG